MLEVIGLDARHDGRLGTELQERAVALVGLDNQPFPRVPRRTGADLVELAANDEGRTYARLHEDESEHRRRRRLAVGAGHGDGPPGGDDRSQHLRPAEDGGAGLPRRPHFGVASRHGGRDRHRVDVGDERWVVADVDANAEAAETLEVGRRLQVAARDRVAHARQHIGNGAHPGAARADDMNALGNP